MYLANSLTSISHLPWWQQLAIGIGLLALGAGLHLAEKRIDNGFFDIAATVTGIAALIVLFGALF